MPAEKIQFFAEHSHCVSISGHWNSSLNLRRDPGHRVEIKDINLIETFLAVVAAKHVEFAADPGHGVAGPRWWFLASHLRFIPN